MKIRSLQTLPWSLLCLIVSGGLGVEAADLLPPTDLRCEFLVNPQGIDIARPHLSWRLEWPERGQTQTAYRVLVASQPDLLAQDQGDLWDSGKVNSDQSIHVEYAGKELKSEMYCYWKVQAWDQTGRLSSWSDTPARWSMGLLSPEDWKAKWIGLDRGEEKQAENDHRRLSARMVRHEFPVEKNIARATAYLCGLGFSELYLNGRKVDTRVMDPTHSRYDKRAMYVTFDVTEYVRKGRNAAGVILGNGRFFAPRVTIPAPTPTFGFPKLLFQLRIEYVDGSSQLVVSDETWKITNQGPIRANSEFDGEEYDARMEQPGWDQEGFDDSKWQPAQLVAAPGGQTHRPNVGTDARYRDAQAGGDSESPAGHLCGRLRAEPVWHGTDQGERTPGYASRDPHDL